MSRLIDRIKGALQGTNREPDHVHEPGPASEHAHEHQQMAPEGAEHEHAGEHEHKEGHKHC